MNCKDSCDKNCKTCEDTKNSTPRKWADVYPQGTTEGDEEQKLFIALARHPEYEWRSVAAISKESGLSKERVEEILQKYYKKGIVFQSPKNEDLWGYWERVPEMLNKNGSSITEKDHENRVDSAMQDAVLYAGPAIQGNQYLLNFMSNFSPICTPQKWSIAGDQ